MVNGKGKGCEDEDEDFCLLCCGNICVFKGMLRGFILRMWDNDC